jgi:hypothetical protein
MIWGFHWPRDLRHESAASRLLGLWVRIPSCVTASCECSVSRADHSSRAVVPSVVCLSVIVKPPYWEGIAPLGAVAPWKKKIVYDLHPRCDSECNTCSIYCARTNDGSFHYNQHIHYYTRLNVLTMSQDKLISWHLAILEMQVRYQLLHFDFRKSIVSVVAHSREMRLAQRGRVRIINLHHWQVADDS